VGVIHPSCSVNIPTLFTCPSQAADPVPHPYISSQLNARRGGMDLQGQQQIVTLLNKKEASTSRIAMHVGGFQVVSEHQPPGDLLGRQKHRVQPGDPPPPMPPPSPPLRNVAPKRFSIHMDPYILRDENMAMHVVVAAWSSCPGLNPWSAQCPPSTGLFVWGYSRIERLNMDPQPPSTPPYCDGYMSVTDIQSLQVCPTWCFAHGRSLSENQPQPNLLCPCLLFGGI